LPAETRSADADSEVRPTRFSKIRGRARTALLAAPAATRLVSDRSTASSAGRHAAVRKLNPVKELPGRPLAQAPISARRLLARPQRSSS